ncbi:MAG: hypothetical protein KDH16_23810 [Rhodocyclaceae bacterium]|jgi:hypothetical protein|nr:hypothetical protein [Rhodocyclaceae bacterium]
MTLLEETLQLLKLDKGDRTTTAAETGLHKEWLSKLAQNAIADPGVNKIEQLNAYLKAKYPDQTTAA